MSLTFFLASLLLPSHYCLAQDLSLSELLKSEISKKYMGAVVRTEGPVKWVRGGDLDLVSAVSLLGDDGRGNMHFIAKDETHAFESEGWVSFSARASAKVAVKRIRPGELLREDMFMTQTLELSSGMAHESRGILFPDTSSVNGLETIQTILEGQFLTSVAIQRIPDVRRGDVVRIHLISGDLVLTTSGIAEEQGYIKGRVRVMTGKLKRELSGLLRSGGIVEVLL
jgi:flagella basal body P-ring formation protein FlgA